MQGASSIDLELTDQLVGAHFTPPTVIAHRVRAKPTPGEWGPRSLVGARTACSLWCTATLAVMKPPAPRILRRGAVIRVQGPAGDTTESASAWAISFVDLQFDDGHVERWLGSGSVRDGDLVPRADLLAWGSEVADEHSLLADLGMAFSGVDRGALESAPVEVVVEWNAQLPDLP